MKSGKLYSEKVNEVQNKQYSSENFKILGINNIKYKGINGDRKAFLAKADALKDIESKIIADLYLYTFVLDWLKGYFSKNPLCTSRH